MEKIKFRYHNRLQIFGGEKTQKMGKESDCAFKNGLHQHNSIRSKLPIGPNQSEQLGEIKFKKSRIWYRIPGMATVNGYSPDPQSNSSGCSLRLYFYFSLSILTLTNFPLLLSIQQSYAHSLSFILSLYQPISLIQDVPKKPDFHQPFSFMCAPGSCWEKQALGCFLQTPGT